MTDDQKGIAAQCIIVETLEQIINTISPTASRRPDGEGMDMPAGDYIDVAEMMANVAMGILSQCFNLGEAQNLMQKCSNVEDYLEMHNNIEELLTRMREESIKALTAGSMRNKELIAEMGVFVDE